MGLIRVIFELLVLYLVYKLIFDFIIPVYKTTKQVNEKVGEMQRNMNDLNKRTTGSGGQSQANAAAEKHAMPPKEDYIEFEEVK